MQVIFTADDFGRCSAINRAVLDAHRLGVLTSASLMVAGAAAREAVSLARQKPTLAVGLHLVIADGQAVLPRDKIPHLVDTRGRFSPRPADTALRYAFSAVVRRELAHEIAAQFEQFVATGLPLSHVDGHQHLHIHPSIFDQVVSLAAEYGAGGMRLPRDDLPQALRYCRQGAGTKLVWALTFGALHRRCRTRLAEKRLRAVSRVFGLYQSGHMSEPYVIGLLRQLKSQTAELYFHPTTGVRLEALGPNPGDLVTLCSPKVRQVLGERGISLATYRSLREG